MLRVDVVCDVTYVNAGAHVNKMAKVRTSNVVCAIEYVFYKCDFIIFCIVWSFGEIKDFDLAHFCYS